MPQVPAVHTGIAASSGIAIGRVLKIETTASDITRKELTSSQVAAEKKRFKKAVKSAEEECHDIREKVARELGEDHAYIIDSHLMILKDDMLIARTLDIISHERVNADYALISVMDDFVSKFTGMTDSFMEDRIRDIQDVVFRLLHNFSGSFRPHLDQLDKDCIIIAHELTPSQTAEMDKKHVKGLVTEVGGQTSHTVILARSLKIPTVIGIQGILEHVQTNNLVIVDGNEGIVALHPDMDLLQKYKIQKKFIEKTRMQKSRRPVVIAETKDGYRIEVAANMELVEELDVVVENDADGIGLFRTEFLYLRSDHIPTEEEHFEVYKHTAERMGQKPTIIRTLDLGADKWKNLKGIAYSRHREKNPALGLRAIRLCFQEENLFQTQLRAIMRASAYGNVHIMLPFITCSEEILTIKVILEEIKEELYRENIPYNNKIQIGIMIETPAAAITADILAKECDFFSIGTNDLIQYFMAADRVNQSVAYYYRAIEPSIIRTLNNVATAAHRNGIWVGLCGEMAGDPMLALLLLGLGMDELSITPVSIQSVKDVIRRGTYAFAKDLSERILNLSSYNEISETLEAEMKPYLET